MLLSGTMKAMPVPGTSMRSRDSSPFRSRSHTCPVTTLKVTDLSEDSSPRQSIVSLLAVPVPRVTKFTATRCSL